MSVFEAAMIFCFGVSWPFSIYKSYQTKSVKGKSLVFLLLVFTGYLAGIFHKIYYNFDLVIILYIINAIMVLIDVCLYAAYVKNK
jgi:hypothetical protein